MSAQVLLIACSDSLNDDQAARRRLNRMFTKIGRELIAVRKGFAMLRCDKPLSKSELERLNERWRKLIAVARDPSCTPAERRAFAAKANELKRQVLEAPEMAQDDSMVSGSALWSASVPLWAMPIATAFVMYQFACNNPYRWMR